MAHKTFILHDESVNTYGFRMLTSGANLDEFKKNPVMLLNHNDWALPIGRWENIRIEGTQILADAVFDEKDERGLEVMGKVERNFVRMASIGAWPPEETSNDEFLKLQGQTGPTVIKWTAREGSICPIGSNHNALALYDRITGKRIDLNDNTSIIKLFDMAGSAASMSNNNSNEMKKLNQILKLSDSASDDAVIEAVQSVLKAKDDLQIEVVKLKDTNKDISGKLEVIETVKKEAQKAEAIKLVDEATAAGRINANGKESWLNDFEKDHDGAKTRLSSISARQSVASQVEKGKSPVNVQLADMSFKDIVKDDRLKELKQDHALYVQKFREEYGHDPA